jgi:flagellar biosynthetic protein FliR
LSVGFQEALVGAVETFMLVFVRMTGMFVVSPIFGRRNLPSYYKVGFAFFLALLLTASGAPAMPETGGGPLEFALIALKEVLVGIAIGFIPYLMFSAIYLAGQLIDMKIGFSMVSVLDPVSNLQIPVTSNFYFILCMLVFITANAHHAVIRAIYESYAFVPVGALSVGRGVVDGIFRLFSDIFVLGFRMAAPIVFTVLLTDVALGIISKAMPQMNVFMVGMPLKILVGLVIIIVTMPAFMLILGELFKNVELETVNFMREMGAG